MELLKRILSAAVLIAALLITVYFGKWILVGVCAFIAVLMMFDVSNAFEKRGFEPKRTVLLLVTALLFPAVYYFGVCGAFLLACIGFCVIAVNVIFSKKPSFDSIFSSFFMLIYPFLPAALMIILAVSDIKEGSDSCKLTLVFAVLCASLSDTFAYFGGRLLGKRRLCPLISPKKTVAGSVASFVGGACAGAIGILFIKEASPVILIVCGVLCGGFAQIGDLLASMLKRFCEIKDYGAYIPGHGGIMDRMDSIIACLVVVTTVFYGFGVITL